MTTNTQEQPEIEDFPRRRLKTLSQVRMLVAKTLNMLEHDKIDPKRARAIFDGCRILRELIEGGALEARVRELEARLGLGEGREAVQ